MYTVHHTDFEKKSEENYYMMNGLRETTFAVNTSFMVFNSSINSTLESVTSQLQAVRARLKKIEENPKEILIDQIDAIHKEVSQSSVSC